MSHGIAVGNMFGLTLIGPELEAGVKIRDVSSHWSKPDHSGQLQMLWFDFLDWLLQRL